MQPFPPLLGSAAPLPPPSFAVFASPPGATATTTTNSSSNSSSITGATAALPALAPAHSGLRLFAPRRSPGSASSPPSDDADPDPDDPDDPEKTAPRSSLKLTRDERMSRRREQNRNAQRALRRRKEGRLSEVCVSFSAVSSPLSLCRCRAV